MKSQLYFIASLIFVFLGIGHLLAEFFSKLILFPDHYRLYKAMAEYHLYIFGFSRSILDFMKGFSLTMGFMIFSYGALNIFLLKRLGEILINSRLIVFFNAFVSLVLVAISIFYFHWFPIVFYFISTLLFVMITLIK